MKAEKSFHDEQYITLDVQGMVFVSIINIVKTLMPVWLEKLNLFSRFHPLHSWRLISWNRYKSVQFVRICFKAKIHLLYGIGESFCLWLCHAMCKIPGKQRTLSCPQESSEVHPCHHWSPQLHTDSLTGLLILIRVRLLVGLGQELSPYSTRKPRSRWLPS